MVSIELDDPNGHVISTSAPIHIDSSEIDVNDDWKKSSERHNDRQNDCHNDRSLGNKTSERNSEKNSERNSERNSDSRPDTGKKDYVDDDLIPEIDLGVNTESSSGDQMDFLFLANPQNLADSDHESKKSRESSKDENSTTSDDYKPRYEPLKSTEPSFASMFTPVAEKRSSEQMSPEDVRRTKSYLLHQYETKNVSTGYRYSTKRLSMDNTLEDIENELEFMNHKRQMEINMNQWRRGLTFFVDGLASLNATWDPFDVDLTEWSRNIFADVHTYKQYDEILEDLIRKWQGRLPMGPEMRLALAMGGSLAYSVVQQRKEKAHMAQMQEDERRMNEKIKQQVAAQLAQMSPHSTPPQEGRVPEQEQPHFQQIEEIEETVKPFQGPSMSNADYMDMLRTKFMDQDNEEDNDESNMETVHSTSPSPPSSPRPALKAKPKTTKTTKITDKAGDKAGETPKRRGRPKKSVENAVTLDI